MIPILLKLHNFMAYQQEVTLDFQGIRLAALTGENGAGKSSLLDAITWALWGKARAKRDDDLIHLGQSEMEVAYTFDLNGEVYRLIRKRDAGGRGRSDLSLHLEDSGGWRTLTETTLRATQQKINQLLRLDYDTFINSAFLLQGRADEFTTKPPGKRKEILSDILGLQIYDVYVERAKVRAAEKEKESSLITAEISQIEQDLAHESKYRADLTTAEQSADTLNQKLQVAEATRLDLLRRYQVVKQKLTQLDDLAERLSRTQADLTEIEKTMAAIQAQLEHYQAIQNRRAEIEGGLTELEQARAALAEWERRLQESFKLSERRGELEKALNEARAKIEAEINQATGQINQLGRKVTAEGQPDQLIEAQAELAALQTLETEREGWRQAVNDMDKEAARLEEQNKQLKKEMDEIRARLTQLDQADSTCPVCRRPLDESHRTEVLGQFQTEGTAKGDTYRANQTRLREMTGQQKGLQQRLTEADRQLRSLAAAQRRVATLEQSLEEAEKAAIQLAQAEQRRADLQQQLDSQSFAAEVVAQLSEVQAELAALGYDTAAHQQVKQAEKSLSHFENEGRLLAEAERRLLEEERRLARERERHTRLLEQTRADREKIALLKEETAAGAEMELHLNEATVAVDTLQRDERLAREEVGALKQNLKYLADRAKRRGVLETKLQQVREGLGLYRELQTAFGKKGVQALLIESAIPEIEDETNKLLSRMTDSRMHVRFETQREARSGDSTIETLDILISDELGTRDYELYSGGEAFRVNFGIRVALSKVLARRAGARLQTLVIDEGFGTQDVQGRERLVEAINAIQDDFEKIIVITHIDELKDAFPVRIEVIKTADGSRVLVR